MNASPRQACTPRVFMVRFSFRSHREHADEPSCRAVKPMSAFKPISGARIMAPRLAWPSLRCHKTPVYDLPDSAYAAQSAGPPASLEAAREVLRRTFGHSDFRGLQAG
jgi:hypothetical protein